MHNFVLTVSGNFLFLLYLAPVKRGQQQRICRPCSVKSFSFSFVFSTCEEGAAGEDFVDQAAAAAAVAELKRYIEPLKK